MCVRQEVHVYETWSLTDQEAHVWLGWLAGWPVPCQDPPISAYQCGGY